MSKKVVLFDLDGTLLPMDQDVFVKAYFKGLAAKLAPFGYEPKELLEAIVTGITAMVKNNGTKSNEEAFWAAFIAGYGEKVCSDKPVFEEYYKNEFQNVKEVCGYNPKVPEMIQRLKEEGYRMILATNPLFPSIATESRIRWAGLSPEDFELYTTYENSSYCKPNPKYYLEIVEKSGVCPEDCIMVGNDVTEDMIAETIGMQVFLITDCLINKEEKDISQYPHGGVEKVLEYILQCG